MQIRTDLTWRALTASGDVRSLAYSWGPANANALAVRLPSSGWLVVSAPVGAAPAVIDALASDGGVDALLAPNAFHYLGQSEWQRRFPNAASYAPRGALPRLAERQASRSFAPAEELARSLPSAVDLVFPAGQKSPDLLVRIKDRLDTIWWLGDLFSNTAHDDQRWYLRLLSRFLGGGPGYRRNAWPELVYVRDRAAWLGSVRDALTKLPPTIVVPAHGSVVAADTARLTERLVEEGPR